MGVEVLVPGIVFGSVVLIFWIIYSTNAKRRAVELETVRSIVDKTGEASPELVKAIGKPQRVKNADLRKGLVLIAIALAFAGLGVLIPDAGEEAIGPMLGVALFPGLVGLVYVLFHFMGGDREDD
jgi:hypothetical protein